MLRRTAARQETLSSLVVHLGLLVKSPEAPSSNAAYVIEEDIEEDEEEMPLDATMRFEPPLRREAPVRYAPPTASRVPAHDEAEEEEDRPQGRAWKTGLKLLLGAALVCTAGAAVFVWLVNEAPSLPGMPGKQEASSKLPNGEEPADGTEVTRAPQTDGTPGAVEPTKVPPSSSTAEQEEEGAAGEEPAAPATGEGPLEAPNLIGLQLSDAEAKFKGTGLGYAYYRKPSEEPAGTVFDQMPKPGEAAPQGTKVIFYVSRGP